MAQQPLNLTHNVVVVAVQLERAAQLLQQQRHDAKLMSRRPRRFVTRLQPDCPSALRCGESLPGAEGGLAKRASAELVAVLERAVLLPKEELESAQPDLVLPPCHSRTYVVRMVDVTLHLKHGHTVIGPSWCGVGLTNDLRKPTLDEGGGG